MQQLRPEPPPFALLYWLKPKLPFGSQLVLAMSLSYIDTITGIVLILVLVPKASVFGQPPWGASGYRGSLSWRPTPWSGASFFFSGPEALCCGAQAAISRLNTMAAIIGVQDSLQHVGPQLWFLQSLLGKLILIVHSFAARSLRLCSKQGHSSMQHYLAADPSYCCNSVVQPGKHGTPKCL